MFTIDPPFSSDLAYYCIFGGTEEDSCYNHANPAAPLTPLESPVVNSDHAVVTRRRGFRTDSGPYYGGTQIIVCLKNHLIADKTNQNNFHYLNRGTNAFYVRHAGILFQAESGISVSSALVTSVTKQGWWPDAIYEYPATLALSAGNDEMTLWVEEGTRFRTFHDPSTDPMSSPSDAPLYIGGYSGAAANDTEGSLAYLFMEYQDKMLTNTEMNTVLLDFIHPFMEWRGLRKGAGLYV